MEAFGKGARRNEATGLIEDHDAHHALQGPGDKSGAGLTLKPVDPQACAVLTGDSLRLPAPPDDPQDVAVEMVELYWMALLRDLRFRQTNDVYFAEAVRELAQVRGEPTGDALVKDEQPFRYHQIVGVTEGDYVSRLYNAPVKSGEVLQSLHVDMYRRDFLTTIKEFTDLYNHGIKHEAKGDGYFENVGASGRALAMSVRSDPPHFGAMNMALGLFNMGVEQRMAVPGDAHAHFIERPGIVDFTRMLGELMVIAQSSWDHKWHYMRQRPEEWGVHAENRDDWVPQWFFETQAAKLTKEKQGTHLLSQVYPDGCPTHPAFPAMHSLLFAAGATMCKAWFVDAPWPTGYDIREGVTVHGELNKAAFNGSVGRSWAGVHYRSDNLAGLALGEELALDYLRTQGVDCSDVRSMFGTQVAG